MHILRGVLKREPPRRAKCEVGVPLSLDGRVFERPNSMKERGQEENEIKAKGVETELCLNSGLWNRSLAADNAPEKQGLDSLKSSPIYL